MTQKLPPIRVITKVDPNLAEMVRKIHQMRRRPLNNLKKAAMDFGRETAAGRGGIMSQSISKLAAAAAGYYFWQTRK
jgi:hypothetical protein